MIENTILKANRTGRKALVFSLTYKDLWAVEAAAQVGFDAGALDGEHGAFSPADIDDLVRVANGYGLSVMARVPNIQPNTLNLWLDRGIQGVVGPHIESQEEAQRFCRKFPFLESNRKIGYKEFNELQITNRLKKQICARTLLPPACGI